MDGASQVAQWAKKMPAMQETQEIRVQFLGQEDPLLKEMTTHSNIPALRMLWTEDPGRLQSIGCKELDVTEHTHITLSVFLVFFIIHFYLCSSVWKHFIGLFSISQIFFFFQAISNLLRASVNSVGLVIFKIDFTSGPGARVDHPTAFV